MLYDSGCHCLRGGCEKRSWGDVVDRIVIQSNQDVLQEMLEFWQLEGYKVVQNGTMTRR